MAADRHTWTIQLLDIQPEDRLLEVGCGHGVAVSLACERLDGGHILAIDRSEKMIALARRRNQQWIDAGRASFQVAESATACLGSGRFDKIFAINVAAFWRSPAPELAAVRPALVPGGALYIVHQPPAPGKERASTEALRGLLPARGYRIHAIPTADLEPAPAVCVVAVPDDSLPAHEHDETVGP